MKRSRSTLLTALLALSLLLAACGGTRSAAPEPLRSAFRDPLFDPAQLKALGGGPLVDPELGNCPLHEIDIPGEGGYIQGTATVGGVAVAPGSAPFHPVGPVGEAAAKLVDDGAAQRTAILVVDDFNGGGNNKDGNIRGGELGAFVLDPDQGAALASLQGQLAGFAPGDPERGRALAGALEQFEADGRTSHGAFVFTHTLGLLAALDPTAQPDAVAVHRSVADLGLAYTPFDTLAVEFPALGVTVVAVDTLDFDTREIAGRIAATLRTLSAEHEIRGFAVNLSFGLLPCSVRDDLRKHEIPTFQAYVEALANANPALGAALTPEAFHAELALAITAPVGNDPLRLLSERDPRDAISAVYLAAAGNYRMDFSLYPGRWPEFVSVSASSLQGAPDVRDPAYSNAGEVLLPGGHVQLTSYDLASGWSAHPLVGLAGTSFAAPVASVFTALDLRSAAPRCAPASSGRSPLAFFDPAAPAPHPPLDVPLTDAVRRYCLPASP